MDQYNYLICSALRGGHPDIINFAPWHSPYTIGNSPFFNYLFPDSNGEINFDFAANGGNNNNRHEINETILYGMEYDEQFLLWGNKIYECGFQEDLLSLFGISGKVENNQTIQGNFLIGGDLSINNGTPLELNNSVKFFLNNSKITVDDLSNLDLNNYIEINGNSSDCDLLVYGDIQVGQNVTFNSVDITIYNSNLQTNFQNCAFIGSALFNGGSLLNINNSVFSECVALWSINGDVTITGSNFNCTWLLLENMVGDPANSVNISNNDFA